MIQHEGLSAVITVYPIAILLLAVEIRALQPMVATTRGGRIQLIAGGAISFLVVLAATSAVNESARVLLFGGELGRYGEVVIVLGGAGLGVIVPIWLLLLMGDRIGIWDMMSQWAAARRGETSARERLDWFNRVERLNPRVERLSADTRAWLEEQARREEVAEREQREREARRFGDSDIDPADNV